MNWLLIVIITLWSIMSLVGLKKGFIRMLYTLCSFVLALLITLILSPIVETFIVDNTKIDEFIHKQYTSYIEEKGAELADSIYDTSKYINNDVSAGIGEAGTASMAQSFTDTTISILTFLIIWILSSIILRIILNIIKVVERIPIIKGVNRTLGFVAGAVTGLFVIWLFFSIITIFATTEFGVYCIDCISESSLLTALYRINIFN